jgi:hypothetical protein
MTKHLGNNGRIPRMTDKYAKAKSGKWFTDFLHDKYCNEEEGQHLKNSGFWLHSLFPITGAAKPLACPLGGLAGGFFFFFFSPPPPPPGDRRFFFIW